ncbi:glycosyl-4,4'-diaponeurosporenoate acyltransferase [Halobacillus litoralis]|uniref:glycosyl-4,4'-diaponeurosporenoate acyltransferase CrtO family protein n=1 Tax=Halobacillus litoralis TaxID=45668 RepID=UPI001CFE2A83|nr:glycosyl-4,4'-diaponeurosporenoate acyltransferase [Halobacillus litoralis]
MMVWINIAVWVVIHLTISVMVFLSPPSFIQMFSRVFSPCKWEKHGRFYEHFYIKKWKNRLPEARKWMNKGRGKKAMSIRDPEQTEIFYLMTNRSEISHWLQILPAPLFFLFNPVWAGWIMVAYALLFNLPFIMIQRYNRARLWKVHSNKGLRRELEKRLIQTE